MSIFMLILAILALITLFASVKIVEQYEKGIVLRLGKFKAVVEPGLNLVIPYLDKIMKTDMREKGSHCRSTKSHYQRQRYRVGGFGNLLQSIGSGQSRV